MTDTPTPPSGPIGQYYLLDRIAQGGMAEIYKGLAYDLHGIRRTVVIKKILPHIAAHREFIDMLVSEAKLAVQLSHGNIAQVYDLGKVGDDYFMVMEYVDGKSVSQIMRKAAQMNDPIPIPIAVHIAAEAAAGLQYMHSRSEANGRPLNIIHRDISPQNLMVTTGGTVKIIDFGIAKAATTIEITDVGVVKGKFAYMSPEQASGDPLDWRTDIFSLGVIVFEMLTGRRLFKGKDNPETLRNVRRANVPEPSSYRAEIPPALDAILLKTLARSRGDRFETAGALRDALSKFLHPFDPSFQNADVWRYVHRLFQGDESSAIEEEAHTPLLIIDRTQSAILSSEHSEREGEAPTALPVEGALPAPMIDENSEWTPLLTDAQRQRRRQTLMVTALVAVLSVGAAVGLGWWRSQWMGKQATVLNAPTQNLPGTPVPPEDATRPVIIPTIPAQPPPPAEPFGDIVLDSTPPGAEIFMDDRPTGQKTPATIAQLPAGATHQIGLNLKGYKFWSAPVTITAGGVIRLNPKLEVDYARLEVVATPVGAEVLINGKLAGTSPVIEKQLLPGDVFEIVVQKTGYLKWEKTIRTEPGRHVILRPILERDPKAGPTRPSFVDPLTPAPTVLPKAE